MSGNNRILAIWGAPGAGKTATAVKLAMELAAHKKNTVILQCDFMAPAPQTLLPGTSTDGKSLGELLSLSSISQVAILKRCIPFGKNPYVSLLGYKSGDNAFSYAKYAKERAVDLITLLRHVADYTIIDCSSAFALDVLSAVALENADAVLRLCACDLKSLSYFASALPLLADGRYAQDRHIKALSMVKPGQDSGEYHNAFGGVSYTLPFIPELEEQFNEGRLEDELCTKVARGYHAAIQSISHDILLGKPEAQNTKIWPVTPAQCVKKEKPVKEKPPKEQSNPSSGFRPLSKSKPVPEKPGGGIFEKLNKPKGGRP